MLPGLYHVVRIRLSTVYFFYDSSENSLFIFLHHRASIRRTQIIPSGAYIATYVLDHLHPSEELRFSTLR